MVNDFIQNRYACKRYNDKVISSDDLEDICRAGYLAPTSCNMQPFHILRLCSPGAKQKMLDICMNQGTVRTADKIIVILAMKRHKNGITSDRYKEIVTSRVRNLNEHLQNKRIVPYDTVEERIRFFCDKSEREYLSWSQKQCYLVAMQMMNEASAKGIDSCPVEGFSKEIFHDNFKGFQDDFEPTLILTLGYRDEKQPKRDRLPYETFFTEL